MNAATAQACGWIEAQEPSTIKSLKDKKKGSPSSVSLGACCGNQGQVSVSQDSSAKIYAAKEVT